MPSPTDPKKTVPELKKSFEYDLKLAGAVLANSSPVSVQLLNQLNGEVLSSRAIYIVEFSEISKVTKGSPVKDFESLAALIHSAPWRAVGMF